MVTFVGLLTSVRLFQAPTFQTASGGDAGLKIFGCSRLRFKLGEERLFRLSLDVL